MNILNAHEVHLWSAIINTEKIDFYAALLSSDEKARAERFKFAIHRERFIIARGILRCLLSQYLGVAPQEIVFNYTEHRKPYLADQELQFNLAHSHERVVYAFTLGQSVGVDIERKHGHDIAALARRFFSAEETASILSLSEPERADAFYHIWCGKEAVLKAVGLGLAHSLSSFTIPLHDSVILMLEDKTWHIDFPALDPEYAMAVAVEGRGKKQILVENY